MRPCITMSYPEFSGCYALVRAGQVVHVGQSINVLTRLSNWRNKLRRFRAGKALSESQTDVIIEFDAVKLYPCPRAELNGLEEELILLYDPPLNVRKPKRRRVDIEMLAMQAGIDLNKWRTDSNVYSPKQSTAYRRM